MRNNWTFRIVIAYETVAAAIQAKEMSERVALVWSNRSKESIHSHLRREREVACGRLRWFYWMR